MNILYLSQYFPPEIGATQNRAHELASNLVALGHRVTVLTEMPNHPAGIVPPEYRGRFRAVEELDGIKVVRNWVLTSRKKDFQGRMLFYLSFMGTSVLNSLFLGSSGYDVVYASSPPLFAGLAGLIIAKLRRIPFVFEVRDLWPESPIELGFLRNPRSAKIGHAIANLCYKHAASIVCVTEGIHQALLKKNIPENKVFLIRNGTNPERYQYVYDQKLQANLGWQNRFIALFIGLHGVGQKLETILDAASILAQQDDIRFVFIGEGPRKRDLKKSAETRGLQNVEFLPEVPTDDIARYISLSQACLAHLCIANVFRGALPVKMFDTWACGKPIILGIDGEARKLVEEAQGGIFVEPENPAEMARAIMEMYRNPDQARQMGENGRQYIYRKGLIRSMQAKQLDSVLKNSLCQ